MGATINNDERSEKEIISRIGRAKKVFLFKCRLLTSKNVDMKTRKRLIKTHALSVVFYGSETWTIHKKDVTILEVIEM